MLKNKQNNSFDKEALLIVFSTGVFFGIGGLFHDLSLGFFFMGFLFGAYLGFSALPFFDSDKWSPKPLTCSVLGMLGAFALALFVGWSIANAVFLGIAGLFLGYFAPWWSKHL